MEHTPLPTLKTIAERLNLSVGTVQRALHNKGGYSPQTQTLVLEEARRCGYVTNPAASALRRAPIVLAAVLPEPIGRNRYFFQYIWQGVDQAIQDLQIYNISIQRCYADANSDAATDTLERLLRGELGQVDGVVTTASKSPAFNAALDSLNAKGIPVFLINSAEQTDQRIRYSANGNRGVGKLGADVFRAIHAASSGKLLLLGGSRGNGLQAARAGDFCSLLSEGCPNLTVIETHIYDDLPRLKALIAEYLQKFDDLIGVYAVSARETLTVCETICELHVCSRQTVVGTDVFPELLPYFHNRTLTASIYQYPVRQAHIAVKTLVSHIANIPLSVPLQNFPVVAVFQSNAEAFCNGVDLL